MMMSGLGTIDGVGGSGGKSATVSCSHCNTENEVKLAEVQYTSFSKLITCKSCVEEIILIDDDDLTDTGTTGIVTVESVADGGTIGFKSTDGGLEEGVDHRPVGLRPRSHQRKLKSSTSVIEVGSGRNGPTDSILQQSASLGAIAQHGSELTTDTLKQLSAMIKDHPCTHCGCADRELLRRVEGGEGNEDVLYCHGCDRPYGIDDGMNFFDFQEFLGTGFRMEPCSSCGNDDPDKFTLERLNAGETDLTADLVVRCSICSTVSPSGLAGEVVAVEQDSDVAVEVSGAAECSSCGNKDSHEFTVQLDACNNKIETICTVCNNRKVTEVTGQVCSCKEASVSYSFNEYGYISQIKCNVCGAVTDMSDDARKRAASDGSSCGRTRIRSLDLVGRGDHIAWHQWLGYWHHAIVVEVQYNWVNVIHYNGPSAYKGEVVDEWQVLDATKEEVYRINYDRKVRTYDPNIIVERAKSRLKEHSYNLLTNNCEHFARWCVTGQHRSVQVQTFYEAILSRVKVAVKGRTAQYLVKNGVNLAKKDNLKVAVAVGDRGVSALVGSGDKMAAGVGAAVATGEVKSVTAGLLSRGVTTVFSVGYEIYSVVADIQQARRQRADGAIDRNEFLKITIKRSCEGVGSLVGTAVTLTIPVAYNSVGLTLGTIIGKGIGGIVGRNAARLVDRGVSKS